MNCNSDIDVSAIKIDLIRTQVRTYQVKLNEQVQENRRQNAQYEELKAKYTFAEGNPFKAAKDGYIDAVIDAREVKPYVASALSMLL